MRNNTKIIATIGPASNSKDVLKSMIESGVNVCRLNFSHADHDTHLKTIQTIKEINRELHVHTAILADLQGPKIRVGEVEEGTILKDGAELFITDKLCISNNKKIYISYQQLAADVEEGELLKIDDGKIHLEIIKTNKKDIVKAKVLHGGLLTSNKGVNLPNTKISQPCLTNKDLKDLRFILNQPIEWIGLSFVRSEKDILKLKEHIKKANHHSRVVAKIEKPEAIENLEAIIEVSDAVMVARGDLGVEMPMQTVPFLQKKITNICLEKAKPVIIATQMLESMIENITPTRAEVNDVANSVMDGSDAIMLSGETSVGLFPLQAVQAMHKIVANIEQEFIKKRSKQLKERHGQRYISDAICYHSCKLAEQVGAEAIITMPHSGYYAIEVSSHRPPCKVFAFTNNHTILNTLSLVWGVTGFYYDNQSSTDDTIQDTKKILKDQGFVEKEQLVINIASMPIKEKGMTNMMKLSYVK